MLVTQKLVVGHYLQQSRGMVRLRCQTEKRTSVSLRIASHRMLPDVMFAVGSSIETARSDKRRRTRAYHLRQRMKEDEWIINLYTWANLKRRALPATSSSRGTKSDNVLRLPASRCDGI